jgi:calcium-dependent protein kinase
MGALQSTDEHWLDELDDHQMRKLGLRNSTTLVKFTKSQDSLVGGSLAEMARVMVPALSATAALRYTNTRSLEDDYRLLPQVCGHGADGVVQLAEDSDGKLFAVKSFELSGMDISKKQDVMNEVKIGLAADHPHIVRLESVYETPEEVHLVMENLTGGELFSHLLHKEQFSEIEAASRTRQMLLAIAYLHSHGVAHRDLKLENWMYERPDRKHLKLIDFGVAECWDGSVPMHQICGSVTYMAPEVFDRSYTEKADMWSLGVIVYSLLTGRSLFSGTDAEAKRKIRAGRADWSQMAFEPLSLDAKQFVKALVVADPLQRMSAAQALEHPWLASVRRQDTVPILGGVVPNVLRLASASCFKRACLCMLSWSLNAADLEHLRKRFLALDKEHKGAITVKRLKQSIASENLLADLEAEQALRLLDDAMEVSYSEFVAAEVHQRLCTNDNSVARLFRRLDCGGNGISVEHLRERLGEMSESFDAAAILAEINPNHGGVLGFEEFSCFLRQPLALSNASLDHFAPMYAPEPEPECRQLHEPEPEPECAA